MPGTERAYGAIPAIQHVRGPDELCESRSAYAVLWLPAYALAIIESEAWGRPTVLAVTHFPGFVTAGQVAAVAGIPTVGDREPQARQGGR
eukprot:1334589-Rhodomonas_salina.1